MNNSKFLSLDVSDFVKAFIVAVLAPVMVYIGQVLTAATTSGDFMPDWGTLGHIAIAAAIGYLVKNFATNSMGTPMSSEPK